MKYKYCPRYSVPLKTQDNSPNSPQLVYRARCKMWDCPFCAIVNQRIWRARLMLEVQKDTSVRWYFWTLTLDGKDHDGDTANSLRLWRDKWDKLLKRFKRDLGNFKYLRVFETHKDGTLHVHMLASATYADVRCVVEDDRRENWRSATCEKHLKELDLGWRHDIKPIVTRDESNDGVARNVSAYVTKYLTKDLQSEVRLKLKDANMQKVRMIQTSSGWANVPTKETDRVWTAGTIEIHEYEQTIGENIAVLDVDTKTVVSYDDFYDHFHYPNKTSDLLDNYGVNDSE